MNIQEQKEAPSGFQVEFIYLSELKRYKNVRVGSCPQEKKSNKIQLNKRTVNNLYAGRQEKNQSPCIQQELYDDHQKDISLNFDKLIEIRSAFKEQLGLEKNQPYYYQQDTENSNQLKDKQPVENGFQMIASVESAPIQQAIKNQELVQDIDNNIESIKEFCLICLMEFTDFTQRHSIQSCSHLYHRKCLKSYSKLKIKDRAVPIMCPDIQCRKELQIVDLQILEKQDIDKYHQYVFDSYVNKNPNEVAWCPTPNCKYVFAFSPNQNFFRCLLCKKRYCVNCRVEYHTGLSCKQYIRSHQKQNDKLFFNYLRNHRLKQCPQCRMWVSKKEGCDHMVCRCKYQFCYVCGGQYNNCQCTNRSIPPNPQYYQPYGLDLIEIPDYVHQEECHLTQEDKRLEQKARKTSCCIIF